MGWRYKLTKENEYKFKVKFRLEYGFLNSKVETEEIDIDLDTLLYVNTLNRLLITIENEYEKLKATKPERLLLKSIFCNFYFDCNNVIDFKGLSEKLDKNFHSQYGIPDDFFKHPYLFEFYNSEIKYWEKVLDFYFWGDWSNSFINSKSYRWDLSGDLNPFMQTIKEILESYESFQLINHSLELKFNSKIFNSNEHPLDSVLNFNGAKSQLPGPAKFHYSLTNKLIEAKYDLLKIFDIKKKEVEKIHTTLDQYKHKIKELILKQITVDQDIILPRKRSPITGYALTDYDYITSDCGKIAKIKSLFLNYNENRIEFIHQIGFFNINLLPCLNKEFKLININSHYVFASYEISMERGNGKNAVYLYLKRPKLFSVLNLENKEINFDKEINFELGEKYVLINHSPPNPYFLPSKLYSYYNMDVIGISYIKFPLYLPFELDGDIMITYKCDKKKLMIDDYVIEEKISTKEQIKTRIRTILKERMYELYTSKVDYYKKDFIKKLYRKEKEEKLKIKEEKEQIIKFHLNDLFVNDLFNKTKKRFKVPLKKHKFVISKTKDLENHEFGILAEKSFYDYLQEHFIKNKWYSEKTFNITKNKYLLNNCEVIWQNKNRESYDPYDFIVIYRNQYYYIDVKATRSEEANIFFLSIAELKMLLKYPSNYFIARVGFIKEEVEYNAIKLNSEFYVNLYLCRKETLEEIKDNIEEWENYYKENSIRFLVDHFENYKIDPLIFQKLIKTDRTELSDKEIYATEKQIIKNAVETEFDWIDNILTPYREFDDFKDFNPINLKTEKKKFREKIKNELYNASNKFRIDNNYGDDLPF